MFKYLVQFRNKRAKVLYTSTVTSTSKQDAILDAYDEYLTGSVDEVTDIHVIQLTDAKQLLK